MLHTHAASFAHGSGAAAQTPVLQVLQARSPWQVSRLTRAVPSVLPLQDQVAFRQSRSELMRKKKKKFAAEFKAGVRPNPAKAAPTTGNKPAAGANFKHMSPGQVVSPFLPEELYPRPAIYTGAGLKDVGRRFKQWAYTTYTIAKMRMKNIKFNAVDFGAMSQDTFVHFNEAIHSNNAHDLRTYLTESAYLSFRDEYRSRTVGRNLTWQFHGEASRPKLMDAKALMKSKEAEDFWVQCTVRMHIKSSINDGPVTDKLDYVVLERYIQPNDYGTWKICGKLDMTGPGSTKA